MRHRIGTLIRSVGAGVLVAGGVLLPSGAATAAEAGTLVAGDTGLEVLAEAHTADVIVVDSVADDCSPGETSEHEATVVSFAADPDSPSSGARLNQIVYDLGSAATAKAFFSARRAAEEERVACGTTAKASKLKLTGGPGGVGDARFTVTSNEKIGGTTAKVIAVVVRKGTTVTQINFIAWEPGLPGSTAVAKKAAARLG